VTPCLGLQCSAAHVFTLYRPSLHTYTSYSWRFTFLHDACDSVAPTNALLHDLTGFSPQTWWRCVSDTECQTHAWWRCVSDTECQDSARQSEPSTSQWYLYAPPVLTFRSFAFCYPHSALTYFIRVSEQTAIISVFIINRSVFVLEMQCDFFVAGTMVYTMYRVA
jgi:hypothetical protein